MDTEIARIYGNRLRVRACGLCYDGDALLMVNHRALRNSGFWAPPGGGVEVGQSLEETLEREFLEETNLRIKAGSFAFGCELIDPPLHAIELFFHVTRIGGELRKGDDPELPIIQEVAFLTPAQLLEMPVEQLHGVFRFAANGRLENLTGFYRI